MPGEVLRRALPGEVGAEIERALQERRGERVVAAEQRASGVRSRRGLGDVGDRERRVGRRLDDREVGALAGAAEALAVAQVVAAHLDAEAPEHLRGEQLDLVVAARRDDDRLALPEHGQAEARPGRHAAGEERRLGVLEGAEQRLGLGGDGRVPAAVGGVAAGHAVERRRAVERGGEPARRVVDESADEEGIGLHQPQHSTHGGVAAAAFSIARLRSAQRSSTSSRPTESRSRPSGTRPSRLEAGAALDQRLEAAQARRAAREPHAVLAAPGGRPVRELEGQDAAGAGGHLPPCELVVGMRREPRVVDGAHRGMRGQPPRELGRAGDLARARARAACADRAGAARRDRARGRRRSCAAPARDALAQRRVARRDDSREHVRMPGEVLRRALPGEVGAEIERALQERRRERAVAAQQRATGVRVLRRLRDVRERQQRVGRRLDDREGRARAGPAEALAVAHVVAAQLDAEAPEDPGREAVEAVVAAGRQRDRLCPRRGRPGRGT